MKNDDLLDIALERQNDIRQAYQLHEEHRPVIMFDIQEQRLYAYPYQDYKASLSQRSQVSLEKQYEEAGADNKIIVFVKDNVTKRLMSFSLDNV